jgi:CSLREA domain-containing protein
MSWKWQFAALGLILVSFVSAMLLDRMASSSAIASSNSTSTPLLTFVEVQKDGVYGVDGLYEATSVAVSPDGKHVYATGSFEDEVAVFSRNPMTGALNFVEVQKRGVGGVDGLENPITVTVSPDGGHLYVTGQHDAVAAVFSVGPWTVTKTSDTNDGVCDSDCSLREAIAVASPGDTVSVPAGTYTLTLGSELAIDKDLALIGAGAATTIIEAFGTRRQVDPSSVPKLRIFNVSCCVVAIYGVTIRHGDVTLEGGAILNYGTLNLTDSVVSDNISIGKGGGIANHAVLTILNSTIRGNLATSSAATRSGGGIWNGDQATLEVTNSTISGNSAIGPGGGIFDSGVTVAISNSTISSNVSDTSGGGISSENSALTMTNSTISGNRATLNGGGIRAVFHNAPKPLTEFRIINSTVVGNSALGGGGGIWAHSTTTVFNTIIANSLTGGDCQIDQLGSKTLYTFGTNLASDGTCFHSWDTQQIQGVDPLLGPLQDNGGPTFTHALLPGSQAIDSGSEYFDWGPTWKFPTTDQRGVLRPKGAANDIGAFEFDPAAIPTATPRRRQRPRQHQLRQLPARLKLFRASPAGDSSCWPPPSPPSCSAGLGSEGE